MFGFRRLKATFSLELRRARALVKKIYTGKHQLNELPAALQHFLIKSGFTTVGDIHQTKIEWEHAALRLSKTGGWTTIRCVQHNFLPDPIRLAYMKAKKRSIVCIEAMDSFRHGKGSMQVRAAGLFDLANAAGTEMDQSELVTILAETMIIPDYALQTYIHWTEIDANTIKGTINYHGIKASGIFYFNSNFDPIKFETFDRYFTNSNGQLQQTKWTAECSTYVKHGALRFPSLLKCTWNFEDGNFNYFNGKINNIQINPS